jgi:hypothetical protein
MPSAIASASRSAGGNNPCSTSMGKRNEQPSNTRPTPTAANEFFLSTAHNLSAIGGNTSVSGKSPRSSGIPTGCRKGCASWGSDVPNGVFDEGCVGALTGSRESASAVALLGARRAASSAATRSCKCANKLDKRRNSKRKFNAYHPTTTSESHAMSVNMRVAPPICARVGKRQVGPPVMHR